MNLDRQAFTVLCVPWAPPAQRAPCTWLSAMPVDKTLAGAIVMEKSGRMQHIPATAGDKNPISKTTAEGLQLLVAKGNASEPRYLKWSHIVKSLRRLAPYG